MQQKMRKYILQHAHPVKFTAEILGVMWSAYFLWHHNWVGAVVVSLLFFFGSTLLLWGKQLDLNLLEQTTLGKMLGAYIGFAGFVFYNVSALPLIYGLWIHNTFYILIALTVLLLPHLWHKR